VEEVIGLNLDNAGRILARASLEGDYEHKIGGDGGHRGRRRDEGSEVNRWRWE